MATNVHRGGFGLEKLFRRKNRSPEGTNENEKNGKITEDKDATAKVQNGVSKSGKNEPTEDRKIDEPNEINDAVSQKTDVSKKSKKKKARSSQDSTKADDKKDDSEACKEYIIKDDVGQVKLTEIINNSIKEAVLSIVKEGVCPLADSLDPRPKEPIKKLPPSPPVEETQDKENEPDSPKNLSTLLSSANKTFDSHLCRSQCQSSNQYQPPILPQIPAKTSDHERPNVGQCNRELCPRNFKERKPKCPTPKEKKTRELCPKITRDVCPKITRQVCPKMTRTVCPKSTREVCPKVTRQVKGSSHFRTDNRRMTGNVNIYICSEANENTKDQKKKSKDVDKCADESETTSETKTCTSSLSLSTSKLVAALRKKKCNKNLNNQSLSCLCETPDSSQQHRCVEKLDEVDDDVLCLCEENAEAEYPDSRSSSSRDACLSEDAKFSDLDFPGSEIKDDSDFDSFDRYTSYDKDKSWSCTTDDCPSYANSSKRFKPDGQGAIPDKDIDERCSCCNLKRCQKDRKVHPEKSSQRESRERTSRIQRDGNAQQSSRCPCIVEEKDEDVDRKEPKEKFTVCTNQPIDKVDEELPSTKNELGKSSSGSNSGTLEKTAMIIDDKEDSKLEMPKTPNKKSRGSSVDRESKENGKEKNNEGEQSVKTPEASMESAIPAAPDGKRKSSFFYRSMRRAMSIVTQRKDEDPSEGDKKNDESSLESQTKPQVDVSPPISPTIHENENNVSCIPPCCETIQEKPTIVPCGNNSSTEKHSRSRISTAIASRRSLGATTNDSSCTSLSPCHDKTNTNKELKEQCKCEKSPENCNCFNNKPEPVKDDSCKCRKVTSNSSVCYKKPETPRPEALALDPEFRNRADKCSCRAQKSEPIEAKPCKCCPRCKQPLSECKCYRAKENKQEEEFCKSCRRPERLCCCEQEDNAPVKRPQQAAFRKTPKLPENRQQCATCSRPSDECRCDRRCCDCSDRGPKSMICIYCDKPQENCICRAPIRKCSQCGMPSDVCNCKPTNCCECSGRQIPPADDSNEQTISVTAWKPRRNVRRYFARSADNGADGSDDDCTCWDKSKPYGSDSLPYQKRGVFTDVMSELQQKISGSVCCNVCRKEPCCCFDDEESEENVEMRPCLSTIAERRSCVRPEKRSQSKSPVDSCKCGPSTRKKSVRQPAPLRICDRCRTSPCRCKRACKSPQKKPQAKCYYCKSSPCVCEPVIKTTNPRPFRNSDSSRHRRKERSSSIEKTINGEFENKDNGYRGRENKRFVPCSGNRQKQIRKYCYRGNSNGRPNLHPDERVR